MKIPFFDLKRQYEQIAKEVEKSVRDVLRSGQYIEGYAVKDLEQELGEYLNVKHVITCGNGTDALRVALQACGVQAGDEVITTSFTFFATAEAIAQIGAVPVFADIDPISFNIDPESIRKKISKKTKAILPVHIFGMPASMDTICDIAGDFDIPVIEDACQAIGAEYKGNKTGTLGKIGCFSFYPTKNLGAFGDGGMITTNDDYIALACRSLKAHAAGRMGAETYQYLTKNEVPELKKMEEANGCYDPCKYYNYFIGGNTRLDTVQAAVLLIKLKRLDQYNEKRKKIAQIYTQELSHLPIVVPKVEEGEYKSCWHQYAILSEEKERLIAYMNENGIGVGAFYPVPLHLQKAFKKMGYKEGDLPISEDICKKSVCLPIFPELEEEEIVEIVRVTKNFFK